MKAPSQNLRKNCYLILYREQRGLGKDYDKMKSEPSVMSNSWNRFRTFVVLNKNTSTSIIRGSKRYNDKSRENVKTIIDAILVICVAIDTMRNADFVVPKMFSLDLIELLQRIF